MSAVAVARRVPFVTSLRARPGIIKLGEPGADRMTIRVEVPELWDTIAFDARADILVSWLRREALTAFGLRKAIPEDYVVKLRGFEVLGDDTTLASCGAKDGSTFLLTYRRRRAVR